MFSGPQIVATLKSLGITHVVWLPDSTFGAWEAALNDAEGLELIRVCREGEAWSIAAGLHMGGAQPLLIIQCTGLFESGDALRNAIYDYQLPLFALVGYRSFLNQDAIPNDSARVFTEPILQAWQLKYCLIDAPEKLPELVELYEECQRDGAPGVALIAEGRM
ncbi:hypothetical protein CA54_36710 [Symmachiella macrocystis]|uniref:Thiamine pyrophosphate enzyme N-terminal TPP-binding domain-containing protein n=1 Tax=Symmachiella macrocystis TaxID=2527985 RepID=A0A5C6BSS5_9PLAN|nr:thiamine pyrophosphate-binding protein [Symmachiella macrocystis]TWU14802.1 hypothetical protein CA54_36710 [Symmachiella macrocystis]